MLEKILEVAIPVWTGGTRTGAKQDDDVVDRFSNTYTVLILFVCSFIIVTRHLVGEPIQCWTPAYFKESYVEYANKICWVSNTYYSPFEEDVPKRNELKRELVYYQWVPLILIFQAILFYIPSIIWSNLHTRGGVNIKDIIAAARGMMNKEHYEMDKNYIVYQLSRLCTRFKNRVLRRQYKNNQTKWKRPIITSKCSFRFGLGQGYFLVNFYIVMKVIYLGNAILQLFLLNKFLGLDFYMYGIDVMRGLFTNSDWKMTPRFPRETLCDFKIRQLGNVHRYTVQCVLPINIFNEKIFIILWFWFVFVIVATVLSLIHWIWKLVFTCNNSRIIKHRLRSVGAIRHLEESDEKLMEDRKFKLKSFMRQFLKPDGLFVIRIIELNTNELIASECIAGLWEKYDPHNEQNNDITHA